MVDSIISLTEKNRVKLDNPFGKGTDSSEQSANDKKNNSIFSSYDNNKNNIIELADNNTKSEMLKLANKDYSKEIKDAWIKENLNFNALSEYSKKMKSLFKNFKYQASIPQKSPDGEVLSNLKEQAKVINEAVKKDLKSKITKCEAKKESISKENKSKATTYQSDLVEAKKMYDSYKQNECGSLDKAAEWIGENVWNSSNSSSVIEEKFTLVQSNINNLIKACDTKDIKTQQKCIKTIETINIKNAVQKYIDSNQNGASAIKVTAAVAVGAATGGAGLATVIVAGAAVGVATECVDKAGLERDLTLGDAVDIGVSGAIGGISAPIGGVAGKAATTMLKGGTGKVATAMLKGGTGKVMNFAVDNTVSTAASELTSRGMEEYYNGAKIIAQALR